VGAGKFGPRPSESSYGCGTASLACYTPLSTPPWYPYLANRLTKPIEVLLPRIERSGKPPAAPEGFSARQGRAACCPIPKLTLLPPQHIAMLLQLMHNVHRNNIDLRSLTSAVMDLPKPTTTDATRQR
jgi:hypothetical protein